MGLSLTAHEHVKLVDPCGHEGMSDAKWEAVYADANLGFLWVHPFEPFADRANGLVTGIYHVEGESREWGMGYGGFNRWREVLTKHVYGIRPQKIWEHPAAYALGPFFELIHFADNEGTLGPETCARLSEAFERYPDFTGVNSGDHTSESTEGYTPEWIEGYTLEWHAGLALAADTGAIAFS